MLDEASKMQETGWLSALLVQETRMPLVVRQVVYTKQEMELLPALGQGVERLDAPA